MEFHNKRRQQFLSEAAYVSTTKFFKEVAAPGYLKSLSRSDFDAEDKARVADAYADETFADYLLRYTAGEPIAILRDELDFVVSAYENATHFVRLYEKNESFPALRFVEIDEYERVLQMIGLCFLMHRRDLLPRVAAMFDPAFSDKDTLYEDMLSFDLKDRFELDRWYHDIPYRDLINTMYRDTDEESLADFERYFKGWYKSFKKAPWHDSHLSINENTCAGYFGYWAIEAAALVYLMEFDDSAFRENIVYPKDLVDFAKKMELTFKSAQESPERTHSPVKGGLRAPETGYWTTPAGQGSLKFFNKGDIMPNFDNSPYGETIWQWSDNQSME